MLTLGPKLFDVLGNRACVGHCFLVASAAPPLVALAAGAVASAFDCSAEALLAFVFATLFSCLALLTFAGDLPSFSCAPAAGTSFLASSFRAGAALLSAALSWRSRRVVRG
ncbi:hypothetical protein AWV80_34905 [Cupriavidus sp. UYMU48A]|nr:hypothetical protein AWV80_34905 [Cupriavidus sp. UYMU48A]